jgi:hypothetical protein
VTEDPKPKLGQTTGDAFAASLGGYAAEVDLLPGEIPLCAWEVAYGRHWKNAWGILYLTSHRLVWIRAKIALPWIAKTLEIPLESVMGAEVKRRLWSPSRLSLLRPFGRHVVVNSKGGERYSFSPSPTGAGANEIAREITSILRDKGLLRD